MALTQAKRAELLKVVKRTYPDFEDFDEGLLGSSPEVSMGGNKHIKFVESLTPIKSCCGVLELSGLNCLGELKLADSAAFILWINQSEMMPAAIIATTSSENNNQRVIEALLRDAGFELAAHGRNDNTYNPVSLWLFQVRRRVSAANKTNSRTR